jgi:hypothetical protein
VAGGKVYKQKKNGWGAQREKKVPRKKLRSWLKKGKKINSTYQPPW